MSCNRIVTRGLCTGHLLITRGFGKRRKKIEDVIRRRRGRASKTPSRREEEECQVLLLSVWASLDAVDKKSIKSISRSTPDIIQYKNKQDLWVKCGKLRHTKVCAKPINFKIKAYKKSKKCQIVESIFDIEIVENLDYSHKVKNTISAEATIKEGEIKSSKKELSLKMDNSKFIKIKTFSKRA